MKISFSISESVKIWLASVSLGKELNYCSVSIVILFLEIIADLRKLVNKRFCSR